MEFKEIKDLIELIRESNLSEFKLKQNDFELLIRTDKFEKGKPQFTTVAPQQPMVTAVERVAGPANPMPVSTSSSNANGSSDEENKEVVAKPAGSNEYIEIKSPIVGTFYRSSSPDKPAFVKVGDRVSQGMVVCIVEAMKLFNEIESEISGKVVKVLVEDAQPVEYDQPLFLIDPKG